MTNATSNRKPYAGNLQVRFNGRMIFLIVVMIVMSAMCACAADAEESLSNANTNDLRMWELVVNTNVALSAEMIANMPAVLLVKRYDFVDTRCVELDSSLRRLSRMSQWSEGVLRWNIGGGSEGEIRKLNDLFDQIRAYIDELQGRGRGWRFKCALQKALKKIEVECPYPKFSASTVESDNLARECNAKVKELEDQMKKLLRRDPERERIQGRIKLLNAKYGEKISMAKKRAYKREADEFALKLKRREAALSEFWDKFCELIRLAVLQSIDERRELQQRLLRPFSHERDIIHRILSDRREFVERKQLRAEAIKAAEDRVKREAEQQQTEEQLRKQQEELVKQQEELVKSYLTLLHENGMKEVSCVIYKEHILVFCYKRGEEIVSLSYDTRSREQDSHGSISNELAANLIAMRLQINEFQKSLGGKATHD